MANADYYGKASITDNSDATTKMKSVTIQDPVPTDYNNLFTDGIILSVVSDYGNTYKSGYLLLNITGTEEKYEGLNGYPVYFNKNITSNTNPFLWTAGSTIYFRFTKDTTNNLNYWSVIDPYGVG
jgi:hypothetical protein